MHTVPGIASRAVVSPCPALPPKSLPFNSSVSVCLSVCLSLSLLSLSLSLSLSLPFTPRPECHISRGDKQLQRRPSQCRHLETSHLGAQAGLPPSSSAGLLHSPSLWSAPTEGGCITLHCKPEAGLPAGADHPYRPHPFIPLPGRCTKKGHV